MYTKFHRTFSAKQQGFTLIEIIVVVVILAILASIVVPKIMSRPDQARIVKAQQDIRALESSLQLYRVDNFVYPSTDQGLLALKAKPAGGNAPKNWQPGGYIRSVPKDPWGNDYQYLNPGEHGEFDLYSLGADGRPGGEGSNADVTNWTTE